eukprot:564928-Pyramimonas_sp.AAC.1
MHRQLLRLQWDVGTHAKKHPACLQGALGFLGFDGSALASATFPHRRSMDVLRCQGWVSCGRVLAFELLHAALTRLEHLLLWPRRRPLWQKPSTHRRAQAPLESGAAERGVMTRGGISSGLVSILPIRFDSISM